MLQQTVIFGANGLIGAALVRAISNANSLSRIIRPSREEIQEVNSTKWTTPIDQNQPFSVFYCHGPTDPKIDFETHFRYHVELPKRWLNHFQTCSGLSSFLTIGSVHEMVEALAEKNNYLRAKRLWLDSHRIAGPKSLHAQLHTVYGKPIRTGSFLGHVFSALKSDSDLRMSAGTQQREYHHVDDIADALVKLSVANFTPGQLPTFRISHGKPITLRHLAEAIFLHFGRRLSLKVGAIPSPEGEVFNLEGRQEGSDFPVRYRPSIQGVIELLEDEGIH
jgi:hypothetical protein